MSKQQETLWAVGLALAFVIVYTLWGASLLRAEQQAAAQGPSVVVNR